MPRKRTTPIPQPADVGSRMDGDLVARAYRKVMDRQELTQAEREVLKRHEKQKEERLRWQYYRSIPQKHWRAMSGRQTKVINEQAARYDIPFGGATIDLPAVVKRFHDFLAERTPRSWPATTTSCSRAAAARPWNDTARNARRWPGSIA